MPDPDDTATAPLTPEQAMRAFVKALFQPTPDDTGFINPKEDTP